MGLRYIFLALALWGAFLIGRHLWRQQQQKGNPSQQVKSVDSVQCAYCGLHLPRDEAVNDDSKYYCSKAHLKAADEQKS